WALLRRVVPGDQARLRDSPQPDQPTPAAAGTQVAAVSVRNHRHDGAPAVRMTVTHRQRAFAQLVRPAGRIRPADRAQFAVAGGDVLVLLDAQLAVLLLLRGHLRQRDLAVHQP